jgi:hypothetical protein
MPVHRNHEGTHFQLRRMQATGFDARHPRRRARDAGHLVPRTVGRAAAVEHLDRALLSQTIGGRGVRDALAAGSDWVHSTSYQVPMYDATSTLGSAWSGGGAVWAAAASVVAAHTATAPAVFSKFMRRASTRGTVRRQGRGQ